MKKKPVRLNKKEKENKIFKRIKKTLKNPYFWIFVCMVIIFILLIIIAQKESATYFVYNNGGI